MTQTKKNIKELKQVLPRVREKLISIAVMFAISFAMIGSVSYAWYTMSTAPEATQITTTIVGNGNLEIALSGSEGLPPAESLVGDSFSANGQTKMEANLTWGNLLNLSDAYGIENIVLRPATFDPNSKFYLSSVSYDEDGRVENDHFTDFAFTSWQVTDAATNTYAFTVVNGNGYGVRAISSVGYGESGKTALQKRLEQAQAYGAVASGAYADIMSNKNYINTLRDIVQIYLYAQMYDELSSRGGIYAALASAIKNKSSDVLSKDQMAALTGIYREFNDAVEKYGTALVYLANVHQYMSSTDGTFEDYTIDTLLASTKAQREARGVQIADSVITTYRGLKTRVANDLGTLEEFNELAQTGTQVKLRSDEIIAVVNDLININTVLVDNRSGAAHTVGSLTTAMSVALDFIGALNSGDTVDLIAQNGDLKIFENLSGARMDITLTGLDLVMKSKINGHMTTNANKNEFASAVTETMNRDSNLTANMEAKQTYGMVIDLWLRTNAEDSILTLDGLVSTKTDYVPSKVVLSGESVSRDAYIYKRPTTATLGEGSYLTEDVVVYREEDENGIAYYYSVQDRTIMYLEELVTVDVKNEDGTPVLDEDGKQVTTVEVRRALDKDGNPIPLSDAHLEEGKVLVQKFDEVVTVTGFNGANRVYDDVYVDSGELSATQGSGSCFIFYPSSPEEADSTLELLKYLKIAFVDAESQLLAQAYFDVEHVFATSGKHVVPLVISSGDCTYEDEKGNICHGITALEKNVATRISVVMYLEGKGLENSMAMSDSITSGSLNLQFATTEDLDAMKDNALQMQTIKLGAFLSKTSYAYSDAATDKIVKLRATVEGLTADDNTTVQAIFQRQINAYQGTRMPPIDLNLTTGETWEADFTFSMPGTYVLSSLWVDGVEYALPSTLTLTVSGLSVESVTFCEGTNEKLALTAENAVTRPVSVKINAAWTPSVVSARIVSEEGTYISVPLTYNSGTREWEGLARFTESGTYTIQYLMLSGEDENGEDYELYYELDPGERSSLTAYLGLTVRIMLDDSRQDMAFIFENPVSVAIKAEILTNTGEPMSALENVELQYAERGSSLSTNGLHAILKWNDGYYTGTFDVAFDGQYAFDYMVVGDNIIESAELAPIINARNVSPVRYLGSSAKGLIMDSADDVPVYVATIQNARTTNKTVAGYDGVIAVIVGPNGTTYEVPGRRIGDETFEFALTGLEGLESKSGTWTVKEIRLDGVFDQYGRYFGSDDASAYAQYYVITPKKVADGEYGGEPTTEVPEYLHTFTVMEGLGVTVQGTIIGRDENGIPNADFMSEQSINGIQVTVDDALLGSIDGEVVGITLELAYDTQSNTQQYGSYTVTGKHDSVSIPGLTFSQVDETNVWTLDIGKTAQLAGVYHGKILVVTVEDASGNRYAFKYNYSGSDGMTKVDGLRNVLQVYSAKPTVKINSVSTNAATDRYYTTSTPNSTNGMLTGSFNNKIDDFNAVVYMYVSAQSGTLDQEQVDIKNPNVTLSLSGIPTNHNEVTMTFPGSAPFVFEAGEMTARGDVGTGTDGVFSEGILGIGSGVTAWPEFYPAGKQTVQVIIVTYGGVEYTVTLSDAVTINNPQCPSYVDFVIDNDSYTGNVPVRVYSQNGETITITLPDADDITTMWIENKSETERNTLTTNTTEKTVYEVWQSGSDCDGPTYRHQEYKKTVTVSSGEGSDSTWTRTWTITGWQVGNETYGLGETITVTGNQTISAIISYTDSTRVTEEYTFTRTETYYTAGTNNLAGKPEGDFEEVNGTYADEHDQSNPVIEEVIVPKD